MGGAVGSRELASRDEWPDQRRHSRLLERAALAARAVSARTRLVARLLRPKGDSVATKHCVPGECLLFANAFAHNALLSKFHLELRESKHEMRMCMLVCVTKCTMYPRPDDLSREQHVTSKDLAALGEFLTRHVCIHAVHLSKNYCEEVTCIYEVAEIFTRRMPWIEHVSVDGYPFLFQGVMRNDMPNLKTLSLMDVKNVCHPRWMGPRDHRDDEYEEEEEEEEDYDDQEGEEEGEHDHGTERAYHDRIEDRTPDNEVGTMSHYLCYVVENPHMCVLDFGLASEKIELHAGWVKPFYHRKCIVRELVLYKYNVSRRFADALRDNENVRSLTLRAPFPEGLLRLRDARDRLASIDNFGLSFLNVLVSDEHLDAVLGCVSALTVENAYGGLRQQSLVALMRPSGPVTIDVAAWDMRFADVDWYFRKATGGLGSMLSEDCLEALNACRGVENDTSSAWPLLRVDLISDPRLPITFLSVKMGPSQFQKAVWELMCQYEIPLSFDGGRVSGTFFMSRHFEASYVRKHEALAFGKNMSKQSGLKSLMLVQTAKPTSMEFAGNYPFPTCTEEEAKKTFVQIMTDVMATNGGIEFAGIGLTEGGDIRETSKAAMRVPHLIMPVLRTVRDVDHVVLSPDLQTLVVDVAMSVHGGEGGAISEALCSKIEAHALRYGNLTGVHVGYWCPTGSEKIYVPTKYAAMKHAVFWNSVQSLARAMECTWALANVCREGGSPEVEVSEDLVRALTGINRNRLMAELKASEWFLKEPQPFSTSRHCNGNIVAGHVDVVRARFGAPPGASRSLPFTAQDAARVFNYLDSNYLRITRVVRKLPLQAADTAAPSLASLNAYCLARVCSYLRYQDVRGV